MPAPFAIPVAAAAGSLLAKAGAFAKALLLGKKALAGAKAAGLINPALKGAKLGRLAGAALGKTPGEIALRVGPDIGFGMMAGVQTPGDLGDKIIAGTTQATGGILGGVGAGSVARKLGRGNAIVNLADMGGSVVGDFAGMYAGDAVLRAKGGGTTPWEKVQLDANEENRRRMEQQILAQYGLAGYRPHDLMGLGEGVV